ncbi:MAG: sigma 54-interacting transcriptional regulator [Coriobacteriia bacterium]|nr:sigma 54-interacting transcriptional regulator [Coriobacteriia bacterium]
MPAEGECWSVALRGEGSPLIDEPLRMVVRFDESDGEVKSYRRFVEESLENNSHYHAAKELLASDCFPQKFSAALAAVHETSDATSIKQLVDEAASELHDMLTQDQPMPWYLAEFLRHIHRSTEEPATRDCVFVVTVNACREYYWYTLERKPGKEAEPDADARCEPGDADSSILCYTPFFEPAKPSNEPPHKRGIPDTLLFLAPKLIDLDQKPLEEVMSWFNIELFCRVDDWSKDMFELEIAPTTQRVQKKIRAGGTEVLMSSPNFRKAVSALRDSWLAPTPQSLLLCAWTGSGKEVLKDLLLAARKATHRCELYEVSAASTDGPSLLGRLVADSEKSGLCDDTVETVIFLDEIHHDQAEDVRAALLRLLEKGDLGTSAGERKTKNVSYVFAGSLPLEKMRAMPPADFWTRIQNTVVLRHPLLVDDRTARKGVLEDYFLLYWENCLAKWRKADDVATEHIIGFLANESTSRVLAEDFAGYLSSPLMRLLSLRELRTIVERVLVLSVHTLRVCSDLGFAVALASVRGELDGWIVKTFNEVVPEMDARSPF